MTGHEESHSSSHRHKNGVEKDHHGDHSTSHRVRSENRNHHDNHRSHSPHRSRDGSHGPSRSKQIKDDSHSPSRSKHHHRSSTEASRHHHESRSRHRHGESSPSRHRHGDEKKKTHSGPPTHGSRSHHHHHQDKQHSKHRHTTDSSRAKHHGDSRGSTHKNASTSSKHKNEDPKKRIEDVLKQPGNDVCADCPAKRPLWASFLKEEPEGNDVETNQENDKVWGAVLVCPSCAQHHHFELGRKRCRIKYAKMVHEWSPEEVKVLEETGNNHMNAILEATLKERRFDKEFVVPLADQEGLRRGEFIYRKYKKGKYRVKPEKDPNADRTNNKETKPAHAQNDNPPKAAKKGPKRKISRKISRQVSDATWARNSSTRAAPFALDPPRDKVPPTTEQWEDTLDDFDKLVRNRAHKSGRVSMDEPKVVAAKEEPKDENENPNDGEKMVQERSLNGRKSNGHHIRSRDHHSTRKGRSPTSGSRGSRRRGRRRSEGAPVSQSKSPNRERRYTTKRRLQKKRSHSAGPVLHRSKHGE